MSFPAHYQQKPMFFVYKMYIQPFKDTKGAKLECYKEHKIS